MNNPCCPTSYKVVANNPYLTIPLADVKEYLNIPAQSTAEDTIITNMIYSAQCAFESYTRVELTEKTFAQLETCWCRVYEFDRSPITSIESVRYYDENSAQQAVDSANYFLVDYSPYKAIQFDSDYTYPTIRKRPLQIEIQYKAGLTDSVNTDAPKCILNGLLAHIAYLYDNRDCACDSSSIPLQSKTAYNKYKIWSI